MFFISFNFHNSNLRLINYSIRGIKGLCHLYGNKKSGVILLDDKKSLVIYDDARGRYIAKTLEEKGYETEVYPGNLSSDSDKEIKTKKEALFKRIPEYELIVLPLPMSRDGKTILSDKYSFELSGFAFALCKGQTVAGGMINEETEKLLEKKGVRVIDYYKSEALQIKNAATTAEAAVALGIEITKKALFDSKCLVIGMGRIGRILSNKLALLGADVTVTARKEKDIALAEVSGYKALYTSNAAKAAESADIIFNTVPSLILDSALLSRVKNTATVIDLASKPGGTDFDFASKIGIKTIHALALPGIYSPETAAKHIAETIIDLYGGIKTN